MRPPRLIQAEWIDVRLLAAVVLVSLLSISFALVYDARWWDEDSAINIVWIREVSYQGSFTEARSMYANGYGYHVISSIFTQLAGIDPAVYVQILNPLLGAVMISLGLAAAYKIGAGGSPALAIALAAATPEVLFVYSRGTHEKMSITLLLTLLVLARLLERPGVGRGSWAATAIIVAFGLSTMNAYFALLPAAMLAGMLLVAAPAWKLATRRPLLSARAVYTVERLLEQPSTILLVIVLPLVNVAYILHGYSLVVAGYRELLQKLLDGLLQNLFIVERDVVGTYGIRAAYSTPVFFLLETPSLAALLVPTAWYLYKLVKRKSLEAYEIIALSVPSLIVFALPIDLAGGFFGSKTIIVRMVPLAVVFLAPIYAGLLARAARNAGTRGLLALLILILVFSGLALLKATRSPIVSTHIPYYTPEEESAITYLINYNDKRTVYIDTRLASVLYINEPSVDYHYTYVKPGSPRHLYIKDIARADILILSQPVMDRGYYDGLYTVPLDIMLADKAGTNLEELLSTSHHIYSGGGTIILLRHP